MTTRVVRRIVRIDEEKCDGCGLCVPSCAEGALQIIDGKARLISERYCDGLGACLGECPQGAISIEQAESEEFDEEAAKKHASEHQEEVVEDSLPCGCPSSTVTVLEPAESCSCAHNELVATPSALGHWPVQLTLIPPTAPFLRGADVLLVADCVPFTCADFHQRFLKGHALIVACPKLDDFQAHQSKLTEILRRSDIKSLTVLHMEVPCCSGLTHMAKQAIRQSGKEIPLKEITMGIKGDIK
jgi:Pyruvate/2-oxoacid:ferredoxin oxidoreductase delta subunit